MKKRALDHKPISQQAAIKMLNCLEYLVHVCDQGYTPDKWDMNNVRAAVAVAHYDMSLNDEPRVVVLDTEDVGQ